MTGRVSTMPLTLAGFNLPNASFLWRHVPRRAEWMAERVSTMSLTPAGFAHQNKHFDRRSNPPKSLSSSTPPVYFTTQKKQHPISGDAAVAVFRQCSFMLHNCLNTPQSTDPVPDSAHMQLQAARSLQVHPASAALFQWFPSVPRCDSYAYLIPFVSVLARVSFSLAGFLTVFSVHDPVTDAGCCHHRSCKHLRHRPCGSRNEKLISTNALNPEPSQAVST